MNKKEIKKANRKEVNKKGSERMRRFKENQENEKLLKKKKEVAPEDDGLSCLIYWEKNVIKGDDEWNERQYFYNKKDKKERFT